MGIRARILPRFPVGVVGQGWLSIEFINGKIVFTPSVDLQDVLDTGDAASAARDAAEGFATSASDARDKAQEWAENPEDAEVEAGQFSALHHAAKAADAETTAQKWAENPVDVAVEAGQFSALHHAAKAADEKDAAEVARTAAEAARDTAFTNADIYADIATGRAAVADGEQFVVVTGDEAVRYRRDSSSTQTEMARYPTSVFLHLRFGKLFNPTIDRSDYVSELLAGHANGLSIDLTNDDTSLAVQVKDTETPSNNFLGPLNGLISGTGFATPKLCMQPDGSLKYAPHNETLRSEDYNTTWTRTNCTATAGETGPDGTTADASLLAATGTAFAFITQSVAVLANWHRTYAFVASAGTAKWVYLEDISGLRAWFNLETGTIGTVDSGLTAEISENDAAGERYRSHMRKYYYISIRHKTPNTSGRHRLGICDGDGIITVTSGATIRAAQAQSHRGVKRLDYMKTTTAAIRMVPYDWTYGERMARFDIQTTYRAKSSDDLTNATFWTLSDCTAVLDATGPHGEPCTTLTATANNGTVTQAVTSSGTTQIFSAFVRRKTGSGTLEMSVDGGSTFKDVTAEVGLAGGAYKQVWHRGSVANPTIQFRIGTSGDAFEIALANLAARSHLVVPVPTALIDFTASSDLFVIPFSQFPTGPVLTAYMDVYFPPVDLSVATASSVGFFGPDSRKSEVRINTQASVNRIEHSWHDGALVTRNVGNANAGGRIQIQHRVATGNHSVAYNGNASYPNHLPGEITLTSFEVRTNSSFWVRRLLVVPEAISDLGDDLRLWKLDQTDANINSNLLATARINPHLTQPDTDKQRIPSFEVLYERGDLCGIIAVWGQRYVDGYNAEHPQRMLQRTFEFNRRTNELRPLTDVLVNQQNADWTDALGGLQGYTPIKIKHGPYRGRLLLLYMQQDSVSGTSATDDARNLYIKTSDDNGATWTTGVKIFDVTDFPMGGVGFVATGENSTSVQLADGPHAGRVYTTIWTPPTIYAAWTDDFKPGGDGSGLNWSHSTPGLTRTGHPMGTLTEPAIAFWPDDTAVIFMRNSGAGPVAFSISTDYGVTLGTPVVAGGDNTSFNVNNGFVQGEPLGQLGRRGRLVVARSTLNGRIGHKIQSAIDDDLTLTNNYRLFAPERFVGYTPLRKAFENDNIYICMAEIQPDINANKWEEMMLAVFRY